MIFGLQSHAVRPPMGLPRVLKIRIDVKDIVYSESHCQACQQSQQKVVGSTSPKHVGKVKATTNVSAVVSSGTVLEWSTPDAQIIGPMIHAGGLLVINSSLAVSR